MRVRLLVAAALFTAAIPIAGQQNPAEHPSTGSFAGVVLDQQSGEPVSKAVVILRRDQEPGIGTITAADGKFTLRDVIPGAYMLTVERDGYVLPGRKPQTVNVQAGESTQSVTLKLLRAGAISGRILDSDGEPVSGVSVAVSPLRARRNGQPPGFFAVTNDRGEYRVFHIAPGEYLIRASYQKRSRWDGVRMQQPAKNRGESASEAYPAMYYPGTIDSRQAVAVTVQAGADLNGFDLQLVRAHGVRVRGRVVASSGNNPAPLLQMVTLMPIGRLDSSGPTHSSLIQDAKGEFEFTGVLPGTYRLSVDAGGLNELNRISARRTIEVGGSDIGGIEISPAQPRTLSGRIIPPEGRKVPSGLLVILGSRDASDMHGGGMAQVDNDGAFTIPQVAAGEYDLVFGSITSSDDDSYIHSIRLGDTDALAEGVRVGEGPLAPLEIVLKQNGGVAECIVMDENGGLVPSASVLLVPDPPRERQAALFGNCRTRADGTCKIAGITPGEYHIYAYAAPDSGGINPRDPEALRPLQKHGQAAKFAEGDHKQMTLKAVEIE